MSINLFEGGRRIARLFMGLWALTVIAYFVNEQPLVNATFHITQPNTVPTRVMADDCAYDDASETRWHETTAEGTNYRLHVCFKPYRFPSGELIPYRMDADGMMWGQEKYSSEVTAYTDAVMAKFAPSAADSTWIDSQRWPARWKHWKSAWQWALGGVAVIWLLALTAGWILRGFLGIPTGADRRPSQSHPQPASE